MSDWDGWGGPGAPGPTGPAGPPTPLPTIADQELLSNISGAPAAPIANTLSDTLDEAIDNTQGAILYRSGSGWVSLAPGTASQVLSTGGAAADPAWVDAGGGGGGGGIPDPGITITGGGFTAIIAAGARSVNGVFDSTPLALIEALNIPNSTVESIAII